jgi:hypothetical protein
LFQAINASGDKFSGPELRRLLALVEIYVGGRRLLAARTGGVGLQIVRDWVLRFNANRPNGRLKCLPYRAHEIAGEACVRATVCNEFYDNRL